MVRGNIPVVTGGWVGASLTVDRTFLTSGKLFSSKISITIINEIEIEEIWVSVRGLMDEGLMVLKLEEDERHFLKNN